MNINTVVTAFLQINTTGAVIIALLLVGIWYFAQLAIWQCASIDFLWTTPKEGQAVAIMRNGKFHKMLLRFTGYRFTQKVSGVENLEGYDIVRDKEDGVVSTLSSVFFPIRGVSWIGIPPFYRIYRYKFEWMDDKFQKRDPEEIEWILVKKVVYGLILNKVELEGGIPYTIKILVTLQITNPAKALFRVKRWLDATMERLSGWARDEFSSLSISDFVAQENATEALEQTAKPLEGLQKALEKIKRSAEQQLIDEFGVTISVIQVAEIDPDNEDLRGIIIKREIAKQEALAAIEKAKGEAQAINIVNEAAEKMGNNALLLKGYQAIEKAGANVTLVGRDLNMPAMLQIPTNKNNGGSQ